MRLPRLQPVKFYCGLLFLLLIAAPNAEALAQQLPIKSYTSADGLARDYIDCIVPDSHGFLWFCTPEGLSRFDGYTFSNYGPDQGLPSPVIDLLEARDGTYWVATQNGVCHFNLFDATEARSSDYEHSDAGASGILALSPKFICSRPTSSERAGIINALTEDRDGALWCGTDDGLFRLDPTNGSFTATQIGMPTTPRNAATISAILLDRSSTLWVGAGSGLYRRLPDGRAERYTTAQGLSDNDVRALLEDRDGRIWVGTPHGLCRVVSQSDPHAPIVARAYGVGNGLTNDYINDLHQSDDGRIWIGTDSGLTEFVSSAEDSVERFRTFTTAQGMRGNEIKSLGGDRDGNLWIGSETNGAMKLARHGFVTYSEIDGLKDTRIASILEDALGQLCIISSRSGELLVHRLDGTRLVQIKPNLPADIKRSWGWNQITFQDHSQEWWVDTSQGLYRFPRANAVGELSKLRPSAVYTTKDGLTGNEVFRLYEDRQGDIWISIADSLQANLTRWERSSGKFYQYGKELLPTPNAPTAFREDTRGNLWIGFYYGGLVRYRSGQFTRFSSADGLPSGLISDLFFDHSGKLWVATTRGGVGRVDDPNADHPNFTTYTTSNGLAVNQTTCITEDQHGRIYIGTSLGVDRLDPLSGSIKHYTEADGLANSYVNVAHRDKQGALWFGTLQGLSQLVPEEDPPVSPPNILISRVRIAGIEQALTSLGNSVLVLGPDHNQVQIDFVGLSFSVGETLRYQTRLESADTAWSEPSIQRTVNYARLAPGTYRFLVRAIKSDGTVSSHPAMISFRILPPVWQRWWFISLAALFALGLTSVAYRYRINQLLKLERVRTRIASDLHDDIGSNLSLIAGLSEVLGSSAHREDSQIADGLSIIANASRQSVEAMGDIVWAVNPKRDNVVDLAHRMRRFASDVLTARNIEFHFDASALNQNAKIGAELRREIFLIFKEGINNIARHSECKAVNVSLKIERGMIILQIIDDGHGFDRTNTKHGQGLESMQRRAEKLGGQLKLTSNDSGTKITSSAPLSGRG